MTDPEPYLTISMTVVLEPDLGKIVTVSTKTPDDMPLWTQALLFRRAANMLDEE